MPPRTARRASSPVRPAIPRRRTCDGRTDAPIRAFASAQPLTAASHPSRSFRGSASAIPRAWASFTAALAVRPSSMRERTRLVVLLSVPRKETTRAPRRQRSARLKTGVPSITAPSWRKRHFVRAARARSGRRAKATGPLFAVTTCIPRPRACRTWAIAGWPLFGSRVVISTSTSAGTRAMKARTSPTPGPRCSASRDRPIATCRSARPGSIPRGSMARPCRAVAIPVTRTRTPAASSGCA